jgi:hypothetical protein
VNQCQKFFASSIDVFSKLHRVAICRIYFTLNSIEISHQFTKTFEQIKTWVFFYDIKKNNDLSLREIKSLSFKILEKGFDVDTKIIEWFENMSINIKINKNLITKHNQYFLIVCDLKKICTIAFIIKDHDFKVKIIICDIEFIFVSIDFFEQDQFLWVCDQLLLI